MSKVEIHARFISTENSTPRKFGRGVQYSDEESFTLFLLAKCVNLFGRLRGSDTDMSDILSDDSILYPVFSHLELYTHYALDDRVTLETLWAFYAGDSPTAPQAYYLLKLPINIYEIKAVRA